MQTLFDRSESGSPRPSPPDPPADDARGATRLNDAQRRAVEHDRGPLVVLAGPGTGKTRVITNRVAHQIGVRGAKPEEVLALTFSNKAAQQLRDKLAQLVNPSAAERIRATTFHAFGLGLLRRFGDMIGLPANASLTDSAQQRRAMRAVIEQHGLRPPLATRGWDAAARMTLERTGRLRDRAIWPDRAVEIARQWRGRCETNPDGLDEQALTAERHKAEEFAEIARLYGHFDALCLERGLLTFDDLIARSVRLLTDRHVARDIMRAETRHIVVDEFQDTDRAQIELLRLLAPPDPDRPPDLCVVGDDDQSIYGFRGVDPAAFNHFSEIWAGHETMALTINYRSAAPVIAAANSVMIHAVRRFRPDKKVEADPAWDGGPGPGVDCVNLESLDDDARAIASMLLVARAREKLPWKRCAVIARRHTDLDRVRAALEIENIPSHVLRGPTPLDDPAVQDVLAWVHLLADPEAMWAARRILARPPLRVPLEQIGDWERKWRAWQLRQGDPNAPIDRSTAFATWLAEHDLAHSGVRRFNAWFKQLSQVAASEAADTVLFRIVTFTGVAHAELLPAEQRAKRIENLITLLRFGVDVVDRLDEPADVAALWRHVRDLRDDEAAFGMTPEEMLSRDVGDADEDGDEGADDGKVQLLTAHAAKGLEFDTVYLPSVSPSSGYGKVKADESPVPDWADPDPDGLDDRARAIDEERRVFYVACTRAQRRLVLFSRRLKGKSSSATHFFQELVMGPPGLVRTHDGDQIVGDALDAGLGSAAPSLVAGAGDLGLIDRRVRVLERARDEARESAASALDHAQMESDPDVALPELRESASRLAVVGALQRDGALPDWLDAADEETAEWARRLADAVREAAPDSQSPAAAITRPMEGPLDLSYSKISSYEWCPLCFFLRNVMRLPEEPSPEADIGSAVHVALERFYERYRAAEAEGQPLPDSDALLGLGREALLETSRRGRPAPRADQERLDALLHSYWEGLHDPEAEILFLEQLATFPYERHGMTHKIVAKVDRLDRLPDGGLRIVDYKTGKPRSTLLEPKPDDLQLGIYLLALPFLFGDDPDDPAAGPPRGSAEYWLLTDGVRGRIEISSIHIEKVRDRIDKAIDGMLSGRFEPGKKCKGPCRDILGA